MKISHIWRLIGLLCLWCPWVQNAAAQEVTAVAAIPGVVTSVPSGITYVLPGNEEIRFTISNTGVGVVAGPDSLLSTSTAVRMPSSTVEMYC